jgi:phenylalanyl-tRNA synthetase beta chain
VPSWRHDITIPEDLAEEVLRIVGYDSIPMVSLPKSPALDKPAFTQAQTMRHLSRRLCAARGFDEVVSFGFVSPKEAEAFGGQKSELTLQNPISTELSIMRPSLLPHLLSAALRNLSRGISQQALFELGTTFHAVGDERTSITGIRLGTHAPLHWQGNAPTDIFHIKSDMASILALHRLEIANLTITRDVPGHYHPGRSGRVSLGPKNIIGYFGELHPHTLRTLGLEVPVMAFEITLDNVPLPKQAKRTALSVSDFQAVARDFAFVVPEALPSAELVAAISKAEKTLIRHITIFDVYQGKGVAEGSKSLALSVTLQADDRTLTDGEIETTSKAIIAAAEKIGATLR